MRARGVFGVGFCLMGSLFFVLTGSADEQTWNDDGVNDVWSTADANWTGGAVWANGNSALFSGGGETVDVSGALSVANITFQANGYTVADTDADGTLTVAGSPSVFTVAGASNKGTVSEALGGSGGITKAGDGVLALTATTNTFTGVLRVSSGTLLLNRGALYALGAAGAGNETIVENGATLNFNGAYTNNFATTEHFQIAGVGADGLGALVNTGAGFMNGGFGTLTLLGDATLGCVSRIDIRNPVAGNGYTLTKSGGSELAVGAAVTNCAVVITAGNYTYMNDLALGGKDFDTTLSGGSLRSYGSYTLTERLLGNGGGLIAAGSGNAYFKINGAVLLNSTLGLSGDGKNVLELNGLFEGAGGLRRGIVGASTGGIVYFLSTNSTYAGPTVVDSGYTLYVGRTNVYAGMLGSGTVTNSGALFGYSSMITRGNIVNAGNLYVCTGLLTEAGSVVVNNSNLYIDSGGAFTVSNAFGGTGLIYVRSNAHVTVSGSYSTNSQLRIGYGGFSLTNGASFRFTSELQIADRLGLGYQADPTNVTAVINVPEGCTLMAQAMTFGNGTNVLSGGMTSVVNHAGTVITTGRASEDNGIRLGHYPQAYSVYNMLGGTLTIGADWDLSCATDGTGWFNMTGGEVFTKRVMLNERNNDGGYGRLSVSGGVLNVGSLTGSAVAISNGIVADPGADYLVEFGGAGGTIRALTNVLVSVTNTLYGAGAEAITFDTAEWDIEVSGRMAGPGGFNKSGSGVLTLSGANTYAGPARILAGGLVRASAGALPAGGEVLFGVAADDAGGRLVSEGDLSLAGIAVGVANPEGLDKAKSYTIATYGGSLTGLVEADVLPGPWYVYYDWDSKRVQIKAAVGTLIRLM
jgi:autotransporter-associated beta strand protein